METVATPALLASLSLILEVTSGKTWLVMVPQAWCKWSVLNHRLLSRTTSSASDCMWVFETEKICFACFKCLKLFCFLLFRRPRNIPFTNTNRQIPAGNKSVQGGNDVKTLNVKPQVLVSTKIDNWQYVVYMCTHNRAVTVYLHKCIHVFMYILP